MTRLFRWQGLVVFGLILVLIGVFWFLLADNIVKHAVQKTGTRIVGARVELADADLHLLPLGITLSGLQVASPDAPMTNAVQAQRIEFSLDSLKLLRRKIIIDTLSLKNIRFNTPRSRSGAIPSTKPNPKDAGAKPDDSKQTADTAESRFQTPGFQIPNVADILAREKLETLEQVKDFRTDIAAAQKRWRQRLAQAPDRVAFEAYQARAAKLKKGIKGLGGALQRAKEVQQLQKDVSADLKKIENLHKEFEQDQRNLKNRIRQLRTLPGQDVERILSKYSLSAEGLGNFSQLLFGDKIGGAVQKAVAWYRKLKPLLNRTGNEEPVETAEKPVRGKGVWVRFAETDPLPDLLASHADASVTIPAGRIAGEIEQITTQQQVLGLPLRFNFSGDQLQNIDAIVFEGALDHTEPNRIFDRFSGEVRSYRVSGVALSDNKNLPVHLKSGLANLSLSATVKNDMLDATARLTMASAALSVGIDADDNPALRALKDALAEVRNFTVSANVTGSLNAYRVRVTSDLDQVLQQALGRRLQRASADFQDRLRARVMQKTTGPLNEALEGMTGLDSISADISERLNLGASVSDFMAAQLGGSTGLKW